LWDSKHPKHANTYFRLGGLYGNYEPRYWWFEVAIVVHKMFMTGMLCIIGQGSPMQPLVAILFQLVFLLTVLKLAPYEDENDDLASFVSSLTITLTLLVGFALISDTKSDPTFDPDIFSVLLVVILVSCLVFEIGLMVFTDWGLGDFLKRKLGKNKGKEDGGQTKVTPVTALEAKKSELLIQKKAERAWEA